MPPKPSPSPVTQPPTTASDQLQFIPTDEAMILLARLSEYNFFAQTSGPSMGRSQPLDCHSHTRCVVTLCSILHPRAASTLGYVRSLGASSLILSIFTHVDVEQCSAAYAQLGATNSLSIVAIESMLSWTHMSNSWTTLRENDCLIISDFLAPAVAGEGVRGRWTAEKWDYSVIPEPVAVMVDQ